MAALLLSALMAVIVPFVTSVFSPLVGYVGVLIIYWVCFCIPVAAIFGRGPKRISVGLRATKPWIPVAALALPVVVFFAAGPMRWIGSEPAILALAVTCALINGPLEELAWRRSFRANSDDSLPYEVLGLGLFTLWHVPLFFSNGVSFDHGAVGLIGGALLMGAVWTVMTRAGNSVGWPMVSHALVNTAAFLPFFAMNFAG
ncbi:type II CAAX prenyl endopeptidase Rce1 family protein [Bauldia sp.]|uniref:CPBP family glutamic-type intramembrane protease n=1 Tax=Bauldia sp. TaxID=2575872 RepID=UPI003BAD9EFF